jgi:hypothetical protein
MTRKNNRLFEHCVIYENHFYPSIPHAHNISQFITLDIQRLNSVQLAQRFIEHLQSRNIPESQVERIMGMNGEADELFFYDDMAELHRSLPHQ